jgi:SRSO17 transposase
MMCNDARKRSFGTAPSVAGEPNRSSKEQVPVATGELPRELERYMLQFYGVFRRRETWERTCQYLVGLLSDLPRKNGQTLAASISDVPNAQSIHQFLAVSPWSARELDRRRVQHALEVACSGRECTVVLDEVSVLKQGRHSVGVKRQYLGCVGKTANGQVAVTLHYCDDRYDWPITGQLYLPREWAEDRVRRQRARVPEDVPFATKAQIAMALLAERGPGVCRCTGW